MLPNINEIAVIVAAVVQMALGAAWYSTPVFGKEWMKLAGLNTKALEAQKKDMGKTYGVMFIGALIAAFALAVIVNLAGSTTIVGGVKVGVLAWLGFVATTSISDVLFSGKPQKLWAINNGYFLVSFAIMAAILAVWR